jgi:hypothetical protein
LGRACARAALRYGCRQRGRQHTEAAAHCGEPTLKEQTQRQVSYDIYDRFNGVTTTAYDTVLVEIWTYNFGPRRFVQRITIEEGKIKSIESAGYGY